MSCCAGNNTNFKVVVSETVDSTFSNLNQRVSVGLISQNDPRKGNLMFDISQQQLYYGDKTFWNCISPCNPQPGPPQ